MFGIRTRLPEIIGVAIGIYIAYGLATGAIDPMQMIREGGDLNQLEIAKAIDWAMVLCAWALVSDDVVAFCGLLAIAAFGVVGSISLSGGVLYFAMFVMAMTFLLVHHHYRQRRAASPIRAQSADPIRPLIVQCVVSVSCTVAVFVLASLLIAPVEMAFSGVSLANAIRKLTAFSTGQPAAAIGPTVSDDPDLDVGTGAGWTADATLIAEVTPSDGQSHYWRARTYDQYTGAGWTSTLAADDTQLGVQDTQDGFAVSVPGGSFVGQPPAATNRTLVTTRIRVSANMPELLAAPDPVGFSFGFHGDSSSVDGHRDGHIELTAPPTTAYTYTSTSALAPTAMDPQAARTLRAATGPIPPLIRQYYEGAIVNDITTEDDIRFFRQQVAAALAGLPPSRQDEYDRALAIDEYVGHRATYSLNVSPLPQETDHVRAFLQDTRQGYCDMFASSMAVLCRVAGIPARVATGFDPGVPSGVSWDLRSEDKHAWDEVYFPKVGWVAFDPTLESSEDSSVPTNQPAAVNPAVSYWRRVLSRGPVTLGLIVAIVAILAYVVVTELRDRRRIRAGKTRADRERARSEIGRSYQRTLRALAALGLPRRPSETPYEYLERAKPYLAKVGAALEMPLPPDHLRDLTALFVEARYGNGTPDIEEFVTPQAAFVRALQKARMRLLVSRILSRNPATF
jgi:transglutaminase-like putative cysteine protease